MNKSLALAFALSIFTLFYFYLTSEIMKPYGDFNSLAISIVGMWALSTFYVCGDDE